MANFTGQRGDGWVANDFTMVLEWEHIDSSTIGCINVRDMRSSHNGIEDADAYNNFGSISKPIAHISFKTPS